MSIDSAKENSSRFSWHRLKVLLAGNRPILILSTVLIAFINFAQVISEVPLFVANTRLQIESPEIGKYLDDKASFAKDMLDDSRMTGALLLFESESFSDELAKEIIDYPENEKLVFSWGIGKRLRLHYALYRLGLSQATYSPVRAKDLTKEDFRALLGTMIQIVPNNANKTIEVRVSALEQKTAVILDQLAIVAFNKASQKISLKQSSESLLLLETQVVNAKEKLDVAEQNLANYLKSHLNVSTESATGHAFSELFNLKNKKIALEGSLEADRQLEKEMSQKLKNLESGAASHGQILEELKSEVLQLKYRKAKLLEQGYALDNPGLLSIERKISSSEEFIKKSQKSSAVDEQAIFGIAEYRKAVAGKIIETRESLRRQELQLLQTSESLARAQKEVSELSASSLEARVLRTEVDRLAQLYADLLKHAELTKVRSQIDRPSVREITTPALASAPNGLPLFPRLLFGFLAGFILGVSIIIGMDTFSRRVVTRSDIEADGFTFSGRYDGDANSCAEVLAQLKCIYNDRSENSEVPVILCAAASPAITLETFVPLIQHMVARNEYVFVAIEDPNFSPRGYVSHTRIGENEIYRYPDLRKDVMQVNGAKDFGILQSVLKNHMNRYSAVFIFISKGTESSLYSLVRNLANRILIIGEEGSHSIDQYNRLSAGLENTKQVYISLLPHAGIQARYQREVIKDWLSKKPNPPTAAPENTI